MRRIPPHLGVVRSPLSSRRLHTARPPIALRHEARGPWRVGGGRSARVAGPRRRGPERARLRPLDIRIAVRVENGLGLLVDRATGKPFRPRGANYVLVSAKLLAAQGVDHSTFLVGAYDARRAERALTRLQALGYNTVRVFVVGECRVGCSGNPTTGLISSPLHRQCRRFLRRAKRHRVLVILTGTFPPERYMAMIGTSSLVDNANRIFLTSAGITAFSSYWRDLVLELRRQHAPLDDVLAYDIQTSLHSWRTTRRSRSPRAACALRTAAPTTSPIRPRSSGSSGTHS